MFNRNAVTLTLSVLLVLGTLPAMAGNGTIAPPSASRVTTPQRPALGHYEQPLSHMERGLEARGVIPQWPNASTLNATVRQAAERLMINENTKPYIPRDPNEQVFKTTVEISYHIAAETPGLVSLSLVNQWYSEGAAHPNIESLSLNIDRSTGQPIPLAQLFPQTPNYLQKLSAESRKQLLKDIPASDLFAEGLKPTANNFSNWNLTPKGLSINFDAYQVAAYVYGPQQVTIPYSAVGPLNPKAAQWLPGIPTGTKAKSSASKPGSRSQLNINRPYTR